jgi:hypothetical protein
MSIKEGDHVNFDGETYRVVKIYSDWDLRKSSALLQSIDGAKLLMIGMNLIKGQEADF